MTWVTLHATLTVTYLFTFGLGSRDVTERNGSLMQLCMAAFLVFVYVLADLTVLDKYARSVSPYGLTSVCRYIREIKSCPSPLSTFRWEGAGPTYLMNHRKLIVRHCHQDRTCGG